MLMPKERVRACVEGRPVDRRATDIWATPEVFEMLFTRLGIGGSRLGASTGYFGFNGGASSRGPAETISLLERLEIDGILSIEPPYLGDRLETRNGYSIDEWGVGYRSVAYATGSYLEPAIHPLADAQNIEDLESFRWPDPDLYDYRWLEQTADLLGGRALCCGYHCVLGRHMYLRGFEQALVDPIMYPNFTSALVSRISKVFLERHRRCFETLSRRLDFTQVTDDWGAQRGLLTSASVFDSVYRKSVQAGIDLAHQYGLFVFHHDDGDCRELLPALSLMGIDVLNPLQWNCGMWDLVGLRERYGGTLCFHGGVDNQNLLPLGSAAEVQREATRIASVLGPEGTGYIGAPCHNIQANTSYENIVAMYRGFRY